jgi:hypothetical protein
MALIHEKIPLISKQIGAIAKSHKNQAQGYSFRSIDDVYDHAHVPMHEHGVFAVPRVFDVKREERQTAKGGVLIYTTLMLEVQFTATDGSFVPATVAGEAMDSGDKATNKAMSAALKYAYWLTFTIPVKTNGEMDSEYSQEQNMAPRSTPEPRESFISGDPTTAFWSWVKATRTDRKTAQGLVDKHKGDFEAALEELKVAAR